MALAQIIDLDERRRARREVTTTTPAPIPAEGPVWCFVWMPVYYWYLP